MSEKGKTILGKTIRFLNRFAHNDFAFKNFLSEVIF
jgi:hypothetical protein